MSSVIIQAKIEDLNEISKLLRKQDRIMVMIYISVYT